MIDFYKIPNSDLLSFIKRFKNTKDITKVSGLEIIEITPDNHFYKLNTNQGIYYIYEVDYISSFEYEKDLIARELGDNLELLEAKEPINIEGIERNYIVKDQISQDFYYLFLIKIL